MFKFNYVLKSADGTSKPVSSDYVATRLLSKSMDAINSADSGKWIQLHLTDGSKIKFVLNDRDAEVQYFES